MTEALQHQTVGVGEVHGGCVGASRQHGIRPPPRRYRRPGCHRSVRNCPKTVGEPTPLLMTHWQAAASASSQNPPSVRRNSARTAAALAIC